MHSTKCNATIIYKVFLKYQENIGNCNYFLTFLQLLPTIIIYSFVCEIINSLKYVKISNKKIRWIDAKS